MLSIVQDTIRESKIYTGDIIPGEIFNVSSLFHDYSTQEVGNNYGKDPISTYKTSSDPDTLYHHKEMKLDYRKELLLVMIEEVTDKNQ